MLSLSFSAGASPGKGRKVNEWKDDRGKVFVPFLVYQSGCAQVRLTATIVGAVPGKPLERSLDFACGE